MSVDDTNVVNPETNLLIKFADDITLSIPIEPNLPDDSSVSEIQNIKLWSNMNRMKLNLTKTWELAMRKDPQNPPGTVPTIERRSELKLLGVTFHENPCNWNIHFHNMIDKADSRLYILRICKCCGYTLEELTILFHSLIMSVFTYAIEVCKTNVALIGSRNGVLSVCIFFLSFSEGLMCVRVVSCLFFSSFFPRVLEYKAHFR